MSMKTFCLLFVLVSLAASQSASQSVHAAVPPELIPLQEAEILIYLLPQAKELRNQGMDVGWELEPGNRLDKEDFYTFWVVNSKRPNVEGSVTVGYFSVNKHTAVIWDDDTGKTVSATELAGIQRILRQAHHIDQSILQKFSSLRPEM